MVNLDFLRNLQTRPMLKKTIKRIVAGLLVLGALAFCWQLAVNVFLADYVESRLIPEIAEKYGLDTVRLNIVKIGVRETIISPVYLGDPDQAFLELAALDINYTLPGLLSRHIDQVVARGMTFNGAIQDGALRMPGFTPDFPTPATDTSGQKKFAWPFSIGRLDVHSATINLDLDEHSFQIPLDLSLTPTDRTMTAIDGRLRLFWRGQTTTLTARAKLDRHRLSARLEAPAIDLDRLTDLAARLPGLRLSGQAALTGRVELNLQPEPLPESSPSSTSSASSSSASSSSASSSSASSSPASSSPAEPIPAILDTAEINLRLAHGRIEYQTLSVGPDPATSGAHISLALAEDKSWQMTASDLRLVTPIPLRLAEIRAGLAPDSRPDRWQGDFTVKLDRSAPDSAAPMLLLEPVNFSGTTRASLEDKGQWRFALNSQAPADKKKGLCRLRLGETRLTLPSPRLNLSGHGADNQAEFKASLELDKTTLSSGDQSGRDMILDGFTLEGRVALAPDNEGHQRANGEARLSSGGLSLPEQELAIDEIHLRLPFQWPGSAGRDGSLALGPIFWQGRDLGSWTGTLRQAGPSLRLTGQYQASRLLPGLTGRLDARLDARLAAGTGENNHNPEPDQTGLVKATLLLNHDSGVTDIDLGSFSEGAAGIMVNGDLAATMELALRDNRPAGSLTARLKNGSLRLPEKKAAVTGLQAGLSVPDLLHFRSEPEQRLSFSEAALGDIKATAGEIVFQLESPRALFVEQSGFKWCQGNVYSQPMRIFAGQNDYELTLFCDRLNLAEVLAQVGTIQADGRGTVSGRIPMRYQDGRISINDGFLFSAPGEGGIIHLSQTDILTSGLTPNSPQYSQIDLAREALKNYQYDWAKVLLNSGEDNLHVQLEFDGRPTRPLPFIYDKKQGGFVRVDENQQLSEFKGISLDVNFRIPINDLIGYKGVLNLQ